MLKRFFIILILSTTVLLFSAYFILKQPTIKKVEFANNPVTADSNLLKKHVLFLSNIQPARAYQNIISLDSCASYIKNNLLPFADTVYFQEYLVQGKTYKNVIASYGTEHTNRLIVGAHYDSCEELPGADDNASGTAGLLELGRLLHGKKLDKRIDLVAYTLEEPPFFRTNYMGSAVHAQSLINDSIEIKGMICLEMIGYFNEAKGSQDYPISLLKAFYPNSGNYITVVGKLDQGTFIRNVKQLMKQGSNIPVESISAPSDLVGIDFSDHLNYWKYNYNAVMISNTGFYRNKNYHTALDTHEKLNYEKMAKVIESVCFTVLNLH